MSSHRRSISLHTHLTGSQQEMQARLADWFEHLPPFWIAFALTLTETVGAGILALPIALAYIGPLAGVVVIVILGLVNILTLSGLVEAIVRNGSIRYGSTYLGRLAGDYLGRIAAVAFSASLLGLNVLVLLTYYLGIGTTLEAATHIPAVFWISLFFLVALAMLQRGSLDATVASALLISLVNIGLILLLILLALPHVTLANLTYVHLPIQGDLPWDGAVLAMVFGTVLGTFCGHTTVGVMAKPLLRRDPSGRSMLWGNVAAMAVAMLLYVLWVVAVNGAVPVADLARTTGTALVPLAAVVGPQIYIVGALLTILGMGMASIHGARSLYSQVQEWLPAGAPGHHAGTSWLLGARMRHWLAISPLLLIALSSVWLLWTNSVSFAEAYSFMGVIFIPLISGIFPMLLLLASRRSGDYVPAVAWRWLGQPAVIVGIYLFFLFSVIGHGLWAWSAPLPRAIALLSGLGILAMTYAVWRRAGVATIIEVRATRLADHARFQVVRRGALLPALLHIHRQVESEAVQGAEGHIRCLQQVKSIRFHLPASAGHMLKVWVHEVGEEGYSNGLPAYVVLRYGEQREEFTLQCSLGHLYLSLPAEACHVEIALQ